MLPCLSVAQNSSLGKILCPPPLFVCWVAWTARLYLTDMGSMCALIPEFHKRNITPCPGTSCSSKEYSLMRGRSTLQGQGMKALLLRTSHLWVWMLGNPWDLVVYSVPISLRRCCLSDWLCSDHFSTMAKILKQGGELLAHKEIVLDTRLPPS